MSATRYAPAVLAAAIVASPAPARSSTEAVQPGPGSGAPPLAHAGAPRPPPTGSAPASQNASSASSGQEEPAGVNIATNPIGWFLGFYGLSLGWAGQSRVTVRVDAELIRPQNIRLSGYEIGISTPIYLRRNYDGGFIEPGILVRDVTLSSGDDDFGGTSIGPELMLGWHWTLGPTLNVALALGATLDVSGKFDLPVQPAGYFRIGSRF